MTRLFMVTAATLAIAGCAPDLDGFDGSWMPPAGATPPPVDVPEAGAGPCEAEPAQALVGRPVSQELAAEAMRLSGAEAFRWIPPNSAVTMDFRPNRLNVEYDEARNVIAIRCG